MFVVIAVTRRTAAFTHLSITGSRTRPFGVLQQPPHVRILVRQLGATAGNDDTNIRIGKTNPKRRKYRIADEIDEEKLDKLAQAFSDLAAKEGFDESNAFFADDDTFEDPFNEDDYDFTDDDEDDDEVLGCESDAPRGAPKDPSHKFDLSDSTDDAIEVAGGVGDSMDDRISAAEREISTGRVAISKDLQDAAIMKAQIAKLGFDDRQEDQRDSYEPACTLVSDAMSCSACGVEFQCQNTMRPGFLPPEKFEYQTKLHKIEEVQKLQNKANAKEWSTDDEIEWLLQTSGQKDQTTMESSINDLDIAAMAEELGVDLDTISDSAVICKRCHRLQNFGRVDDELRPGWTEEPMISQDKFMDLLRPLREKNAVIVALVDLFDFAGSILPELDVVAGSNPVIVAANKVDLLPEKMGKLRVEKWVREELEHVGVKSLANVGGAVQLISCKSGAGVANMLDKVRKLAEERNCDIYVVGAANAGKSTLLNHILGRGKSTAWNSERKRRAGNANARKGAVTTSPLPGTTLRFIKIDLGGGKSLYDTPGLLVPGTLTQLLTPEELKLVVPKKKVEPITFRVENDKCVLVGGLAKVELIGDSKPFLFTFFVANDIKLHPTKAGKADEFVSKHVGGLLTPPLSPERREEIGSMVEHVFDIEGCGWKESAADISFTGLGWVSVTGAGPAKVKISAPQGINISVRPPLMPFDMWETTAKYTGSRSVRKTSKKAGGKRRRRGVGRR